MDHSSGDRPSGAGPARDANGRFAAGNPGRRPGSRNRMSQEIALGLLRHYAQHEREILTRLKRNHFKDYMRLIGRMLPPEPEEDAPEPEALSAEEVAEVIGAARAALDRLEAGEGSLAEVQAALMGMGGGAEPPYLR